MKGNCALTIVVVCFLVTHNFELACSKRITSSNRKTSSGGGSGRTQSNTHVTRPSYSTSSGNSHADVAKLSYPNYNSQPNRPASGSNIGASNAAGQNPAPIGWNVQNKQQGPPPAYSASNPVGGARTNMHESPPAYAAPPSYGSSGSNVHTPIQASNTHGLQSGYPGSYNSPGSLPAGATYHSPGALPAGASYYPSAGHVPAGGSYYPSGGMPAGASYYPSAGHAPAGATYLPAGAALPAGATYYSQPPQSSSGLGFGSGLIGGAIGGAILGHVLTPSQTRVVEQAPVAAGSAGGQDRIIIINNGQPVTDAGNGTTIINGTPQNAAQPAAPAAPGEAAPAVPNVPLAPMGESSPLAPMSENAPPMNATSEGTPLAPQAAPPLAAEQPAAGQPEQPPAGGIICVPVRVNETDPNDSTVMKEIEKIACYPAPPPPPPPAQPVMPGEQAGQMPPSATGQNSEGSAQLAPINSASIGQQQMQTGPTQSTLMSEQSKVLTSGSAIIKMKSHFIISALVSILLVFAYPNF